MKKLFILILIGLFVVSCAPAPFKPFKPEPIEFVKTPPFSAGIDKLPKIEPPVRMYVKKISEDTFKIVETKEEASHIMFAPMEYAKIAAKVEEAKTLKVLAVDLEKEINEGIDRENKHKEIYALDQEIKDRYYQLWVSSENAYRQEKWEHNWDNRIHKTALYGITIGSIVVLLLLL